ncbi:MAG: hypothetical protein DRP82_06440 [Planctomycetota bacterium]|nr:MAG: hypothetical protein DRP82_06440 [Planctomycetota bacterium]
MSKLCDVFDYQGKYGNAIRTFANALGMAIKEKKAYNLLTLLQYVETSEGFAQFLQDFSRQYETYCHDDSTGRYIENRPGPKIIETVAKAAQDEKVGVRIVRAALISYALTYLTEEERRKIEERRKQKTPTQ